MTEYIKREAVEKIIEKGLNNPDKSKAYGYDAVEILGEIHYMDAADVVEVDKVAELLCVSFGGDTCACNFNGNDEWLWEKCKYDETECPTPKDELGCWKEYVKAMLAKMDGK